MKGRPSGDKLMECCQTLECQCFPTLYKTLALFFFKHRWVDLIFDLNCLCSSLHISFARVGNDCGSVITLAEDYVGKRTLGAGCDYLVS